MQPDGDQNRTYAQEANPFEDSMKPATRRSPLPFVAGALLCVLLAVGGFFWWQKDQTEKASKPRQRLCANVCALWHDFQRQVAASAV